jgi:hypothetical protein
MAAIYLCQQCRPEAFPRKTPLAIPEHYKMYESLFNQLEAPRGETEFDLEEGPANTAAQAYAFHYYVRPHALIQQVFLLSLLSALPL